MTDDEVRDFVVINFNEYFKTTKEKLHSKLNKSYKMNLTKVPKSLYTFLIIPDEVEKYAKIIQSNYSDNCVHCYHMILNLFDP